MTGLAPLKNGPMTMSELERRLDELLEKGKAAWNEHRDAAAAKLLSAYLVHRPQHAYAWFVYGDALRVIGLAQEAERALLQAHELAPDRWQCVVRLAMLKQHGGEHASAEAYFRQLCEDPEAAHRGYIWIMRGANLTHLGQLAEAMNCHRRALTASENGSRDEAFLNIGLILRAKGQYSEARDALREAIAITPDYQEAQSALDSLAGIDEAVSLARLTSAP